MKRHRGQMSDSLRLGTVLTLAGGLQDAYSYNCRGQVFANAQTGNIVLLGQSLAGGQWAVALHYVFPLLAFLAGVYASEWVRHLGRHSRTLHWRQTVLLVEIALLTAAGFLPQAMNPLANALMSFACAMQVDSFRKFRGVPCATTMCIGNMRSGMESLVVYFHLHDRKILYKALHYFGVILLFAVGAGLGAQAVAVFGNRTIWFSCALLLVSLCFMFIQDEEEALKEKA